MSQVAIGRTVIFTVLTQAIADQINDSRATSNETRKGNLVELGSEYPMTITAVWSDGDTACVNGQVILDGNDSYWALSVNRGDQWRFHDDGFETDDTAGEQVNSEEEAPNVAAAGDGAAAGDEGRRTE